MACCRERRLGTLALLAAVLSGCVTGHLLDAARRRERPLAVTQAALDGDRLVVRYTAEITDDAGKALGVGDAAAAIPLEVLRAPASPPADAVAPAWRAPLEVERGVPVALAHATGSPADALARAGPALEVLHEDGRDRALVWRDGPAAPPWAPVPTSALTRQRTAPWAWPLLPAALAVDAVVVPVLVFSAPALMAIGE